MEVQCENGLNDGFNYEETLRTFKYDPTIFGDRFIDEDTKDVRIVVIGDEREAKVHKGIMMAISLYWDKFFKKYRDDSMVALCGPTFQDLLDVIDIMYNGRAAVLQVPEERLEKVVKAANKLKLYILFDEEKEAGLDSGSSD